jgi:DNA repair exonuclease SbcCD nuclease subunit
MNILFYSDIHIKDNSAFIPYNQINEKTGLTKNLMNILRGLNFVADKILELKPNLVINLGDTFNTNDAITTRSLVTAYLGFNNINKNCKKLNIKHYILNGNHEILNENLKLSSNILLEGFCDKIINENCVITEDNIKIGFIPFYRDEIIMSDNITSTINNNIDIICIHSDFSGSIFETGKKTTSQLNSKWGKQIFSGHVHLPQEVGDVTFIGSLIQNRFDSENLNKNGILLYNTETKNKMRFYNNYSKHFVKVNDINSFIQKINKEDFNNIICNIYYNNNDDKINKQKQFLTYNIKDIYFTQKYIENEKENNIIQESNEDIYNPELLIKNYLNDNNVKAIDTFLEICEE